MKRRRVTAVDLNRGMVKKKRADRRVWFLSCPVLFVSGSQVRVYVHTDENSCQYKEREKERRREEFPFPPCLRVLSSAFPSSDRRTEDERGVTNRLLSLSFFFQDSLEETKSEGEPRILGLLYLVNVMRASLLWKESERDEKESEESQGAVEPTKKATQAMHAHLRTYKGSLLSPLPPEATK